MRTSTLKKWLNMQLDNYKEGKSSENFYASTTNILPYKTIQELENYDLYYKKKDIDLELNDQVTIEYIKMMCQKDKTSFRQERENIDILTSLEVYHKNNKIKEVLIPNNTNRAHTNYLFKQLVDNAGKKDNLIEVIDKDIDDTQVFIYQPIFDKSMKEKFYEFCMINSLKK